MQFNIFALSNILLLIGTTTAMPTENTTPLTKRAIGDVLKPVAGANCSGKRFTPAGIEKSVRTALDHHLKGVKVNRKGTFNPGYPKHFIPFDINRKSINFTPTACQGVNRFTLREYPIINNADVFREGDQEGLYRVVFHVSDEGEATACGMVMHPARGVRGFVRCDDW